MQHDQQVKEQEAEEAAVVVVYRQQQQQGAKQAERSYAKFAEEAIDKHWQEQEWVHGGQQVQAEETKKKKKGCSAVEKEEAGKLPQQRR